MRCCKIKRGKKRMKEISKMREEKNEWMQGGVQKIKGRKKDRGARLGLVLDRVGLEPGRVERGYIRVWRPFFSHFSLVFLSLPSSWEQKRSLLSPLAFFFSDEKERSEVVVGGGGAVAGRPRRRRRRPKGFFLYFFSCLLFYFPFSIHFWA